MHKLGFMYLVLLFLVIRGGAVQFMTKNADNYGPFEINYSDYETCRGPKSKDVGVTQVRLVKEGNSYIGYMNMTFYEQARFEEAKIYVFTLKNGRKTLLWTYKVDKPCQHFALVGPIETFLHAKNCLVNKGVYVFEVNYTEITKIFFGKSFFYGDYMLKVIITSKKGNILCLILRPVFEKKI